LKCITGNDEVMQNAILYDALCIIFIPQENQDRRKT